MTTQYVWENLFSGFLVSLKLFAISVVIATVFGLLFALLNYTKFKPITYLTQTIVWVFRGIPVMLQLIIVYYGLPMFSIHIEMTTSAILVFSVSYGIYMSEIFRGAINSVAKGQNEACKVLGISAPVAFFFIILPQAIKRAITPMCELWVTLVKDTSLARVIGIIEITRVAQTMVSASTLIYPLFLTAVFYLALIGLLTLLFKFTERKLNYYQS